MLEAAAQAGGQIRLAAQQSAPRGADRHRRLAPARNARPARRRDPLQHLGRGRDGAGRDARRGHRRDRRLAATAVLEAGDELVVSSWDIISGDVKPAENVLLYDDNGGHPGMQAAEIIAKAARKVEIVSPERSSRPNDGGMNHVPYMRALQKRAPPSPSRSGWSRCAPEATAGRHRRQRLRRGREGARVDQVVVKHGTVPLDDLYFELKPQSRISARSTTRR